VPAIMAAFAQVERDTMIERTRAGLAAAAPTNRHGGRPRNIDDAAGPKHARRLQRTESIVSDGRFLVRARAGS